MTFARCLRKPTTTTYGKRSQREMTVVHINTEVRLAWRRGLDGALAKQPNEIVPYKVLPQAVDSVKQVVAGAIGVVLAPDGPWRVLLCSSGSRNRGVT